MRAAAVLPGQPMGPIPTLDAALDTIRRRTGLILGVMCLGFLLSAAIGLAQKPVYESHEVIQLSPPRMTEGVVDAPMGDRLSQQLDGLIHMLLATETLATIANTYDLFGDRPGLTPDQAAQELRRAVQIDRELADDGIHAARIVVTARLPDAEQARHVAEELSHRLIRESVLLRIAEAQATLDFLTARSKSLTADLADQEGRLSAFRAQHAAALAASDPEGLDAVSRIEAEIAATDRARLALDAGQVAGGPAETLDARRVELVRQRSERLRGLTLPPHLEQDYAALLRGLAALTAQLAEADADRAQAEVAVMLESRRMAERLTVIDPARTATAPLQDRRSAIAFGGGLLTML
ncbi:MAG: hypothetical protein KDJ98_21365, partial [Rhodobacteraceae bacterium]|nr:hypothetical protein [Paracoccaceae bacterium]